MKNLKFNVHYTWSQKTGAYYPNKQRVTRMGVEAKNAWESIKLVCAEYTSGNIKLILSDFYVVGTGYNSHIEKSYKIVRKVK